MVAASCDTDAHDCRIINGALNYQIYAQPSFEIISLLLEDPSDRECAALLSALLTFHARADLGACVMQRCPTSQLSRRCFAAANLMSAKNCVARLVSGHTNGTDVGHT